MTLTHEPPLARVERFVADRGVVRVETLTGDASNRAYFRLHSRDGGTSILALLPEPFAPETLPFLNVAALFEELAIRVPEVLQVSGPDGILVLEDLGDRLLQDAAEQARPEERRSLYREAVEILAHLQLAGRGVDRSRYLPFRVEFDEAKFVWELEFFRKHYLEGLVRARPENEEREALSGVFNGIASELSSMDFELCHRDYHARNLMLAPGGEMAVIDFQDARLGPRVYDLVSLLRDSYVELSPDLVDEMRTRFEEAVGASVRAAFDLAALQRNLKALGTFGYQIAVRGNDVYQRYLTPTLGLVRDNLARNPRFSELRRILARYCEEIA